VWRDGAFSHVFSITSREARGQGRLATLAYARLELVGYGLRALVRDSGVLVSFCGVLVRFDGVVVRFVVVTSFVVSGCFVVGFGGCFVVLGSLLVCFLCRGMSPRFPVFPDGGDINPAIVSST
jgi:hypothetical protein